MPKSFDYSPASCGTFFYYSTGIYFWGYLFKRLCTNLQNRGDLEDTPDLQEIALPKELPCPVTLRFEIRSVYKGDKYDDTCISLIYPLPPDMTGKRAPH